MKNMDVTMRFEGSDEEDSSEATLVVLEGIDRGRVIELAKERMTLGRLPSNDIVFATNSVSKQHCVLLCEKDAYFIEDCGSTNGIYVNGTLVAKQQRKRLSQGDNIRITDHLLLFRQPGSLLDQTGFAVIELDQDKIAHEADDILDQLGFGEFKKSSDS